MSTPAESLHHMETISNVFHNTEYRSRLSRREIERRTYVYGDLPAHVRAWRRKVKKELCGIDGCTCGNDIGERK